MTKKEKKEKTKGSKAEKSGSDTELVPDSSETDLEKKGWSLFDWLDGVWDSFKKVVDRLLRWVKVAKVTAEKGEEWLTALKDIEKT